MEIFYFSVLKEKLGKDRESLEFSGKVEDLRRFLEERYPHVRDILVLCRFAVNEEYVSDHHTLRGDERVAVIPPVSGG
ncbi:thiamineS protein [Thermocrinis albus DSM 14484]|uniref:Molybdopterin synthase sulfur carrier subunit n=1 Tax=Thermocrinis albus (strain DSM 14484 / JCM 11386 / HI 11/12) TaxID=638303 RepID=D3SMB2_THEAH|nr:molybdopterin converting factor subunit 1 [Thermocrinis albus]ADC89892.1 thiamineS protein [Thermocrinis albus DSM 14484]